MTTDQWFNYDQYKTNDLLNLKYYNTVNGCFRKSLSCLCNGKWESSLDIGCGSGDSTLVLAEFTRNVWAVDSSGYLLGRARERTYPAKVSFIHDSFDNADLPQASFDNVSALWVWNHYHSVEALQRAFYKISTILKADGSISFVVPSDSFTSSRFQKIALQQYGWKLVWLHENPEFTKGYFTYGDKPDFIETTIWQPLYLMTLLDQWFDVKCFDVKGTMVREGLLPNFVAEPPFTIIYGKVKGDC